MDEYTNETPRQRVHRRKSALWTERSSWDTEWREISEYQHPRLGRFVASDSNKGTRKEQKVIDSTATVAARTLAAGMMSGATSPARPWFKLALQDKDLQESREVKLWLSAAETMIRRVFAASNTYRTLHGMYEELGLFGTAATVVLPDQRDIIRHYPMTIGEYALATNDRNEVDSLCRHYQMTVEQLVSAFGTGNVSQTVRNLWDRRNYSAWVDVTHLLEPRRKRDPAMADAKNKRFSSIYVESSGTEDKVLRESGFDRFPSLTPRWFVTGNDAYGSSPGMECLGDVKQLQHQQKRKGTAIDYMVNPPLQVPTKFKEAHTARLPGGTFYIDALGGNQAVQTAFEVRLDLQHLLIDIQDIRERIRSAYYADLFLMLANDTRSGTTATEIAERHEEKLLMLGPVLERLHNEELEPLIDIAFDECLARNLLPPIPMALSGMEIEVEFTSVLAQAQRAVATAGMDRLLGAVGQMAAVHPEVLDKINWDQAVDEYGEAYGVNPAVIVPDDEVAATREARAQAMQQQAAAASAPQMVESAKTAGEIDMDGLNDVMGSLQGYASPTPGTVQ